MQQNKAMHLYFEMLAESLNDAGLDMKTVFERKTMEVPWTKESVKACLWKPIQDAMYEVDKTSKLETHQVAQVYEVLNRHIANNFGLYVPFPVHYGDE